MWAIDTQALTKKYRTGLFFRKPQVALEHLDLQVSPGEILGYIGHNGAGKTTTFKLILGLIRPTSGEAWILGESIKRADTRRRIGFLPEQPYFHEHLTATQFLDFYAQLFDIGRLQRRRRVGELLERVGLAHVGSIALRNFSKGMLQRIGLAQALINNPDLIILDEPMSGLDPLGRKEVRNIILELKEQGKTIIFSSHILADVEMICDRVAVLVQGRLQRIEQTQGLLDASRRQYEIVVRNLDERAMQKLSQLALEIRSQADDVVFVVSDETSTEIAQDVIREHHGKLVCLTPRTPTLESLILSELQETPSAEANSQRVARPTRYLKEEAA